jgi:hypothetical protein
VRRVVIILGALVLASAAAYLWQANSHDTKCPTTLEFKGVSYAVFEVSEEIVAHDELGSGIERGCGWKGPWKDEVALSRIHGVDPRTALVTPVASHVLYVAEDFTLDDLPRNVSELVVQ